MNKKRWLVLIFLILLLATAQIMGSPNNYIIYGAGILVGILGLMFDKSK